MLVVKIELHNAITKEVSTIGTTVICNVGGSKKLGNYEVAVGDEEDADSPRACLKKPQRTGEVKDYPRLSYNVWRLVIRSLKSAFPEEK